MHLVKLARPWRYAVLEAWPPPKSRWWRRTFGRFRSEESRNDLLPSGEIPGDYLCMSIIGNPNRQWVWLWSAISPQHPDSSWPCLGLRLIPGSEQGLILLALFWREHV